MRAMHFPALPMAMLVVLASALACYFPTSGNSANTPVIPGEIVTPGGEAPAPAMVTATVAVTHVMVPSEPPGAGRLVYDVSSQETALEQRTPYGDSYQINRLERPFGQDMTYISYLDIKSYTAASDTNWWYVTVKLAGANPSSDSTAVYGVELDKDHDGFGDFLIWARPPFTNGWDTASTKIFQDKNHDTGGLSAEKSDAPITTDGYEIQIFNGGVGDADPDLAWVRTSGSAADTVQFAFKKAWSGTTFMLGVLGDSGLKDPGKLDYVDRFTAAEAGSPVRDNSNYPLKALFAVDNVCREAFGFDATGYEPQLCPRAEPTKKPKPTSEPSTAVPPPPETGCPDPGNCPYGWAGEPYCYCIPG